VMVEDAEDAADETAEVRRAYQRSEAGVRKGWEERTEALGRMLEERMKEVEDEHANGSLNGYAIGNA
jgi:hypothetical protein